MKNIAAIIISLIGVALSVFWFIDDPGFMTVFSNSLIVMGNIPIPGALIGIMIQCMPAIFTIYIGAALWEPNKKTKHKRQYKR